MPTTPRRTDASPPESARRHDTVRRALATSATLALAAYLGWRLTVLGTNPWLSVPLFVLELWGAAQFLAVVGQAWPRRAADPATGGPFADAVGLVITATFHDPDQLERTLVGARRVRGADRLVVALRAGRDDLLDVCERFGAPTVEGSGNHVDLFDLGARGLGRAVVGWLEAGQVPMPDFVTELGADFSSPDVAVVQAAVGLMNGDSLAHLSGGRDEDAFYRTVLYPARSRHGHAPWFGGGSLVRHGALSSSAGFDTSDPAALERALVRLHASGWSTLYRARELVWDDAPDSLDAYLVTRRRRAIETLRVFRTPQSPLRTKLPWRARMAHLGWALGFGTGIRQMLLTALLMTTLLTSRLPVGESASVWLRWWMPAFGLQVLANHQLARGTLRIGDRTRQGWRTVTSDLSALAAVMGRTRSSIAFGSDRADGVRSLGALRLVTGMLVALDGVIIIRSSTMFLPDLLPAFSSTGRVCALGMALAASAGLTDVLKVVVRRRQRRTQHRIVADLPARLGGSPGRVIDLTPGGVGVIVDHAPAVSAELPIEIGLPQLVGGPRTVRARGTIRSVVETRDNACRVGVQLVGLDEDDRRALIEYCAITHHQGGDVAAPQLAPADLLVATGERSRHLAQAITIVALVLGLGAIFMGPGAGAARADTGESSGEYTGAQAVSAWETYRTSPAQKKGVTYQDGGGYHWEYNAGDKKFAWEFHPGEQQSVTPTPTPTATPTPTPTPEAPTPTATATPQPPTPTLTATPETPTPEAPTPTATATPQPPIPTLTATPETPTPEAPTPTATATPQPPTPTPESTEDEVSEGTTSEPTATPALPDERSEDELSQPTITARARAGALLPGFELRDGRDHTRPAPVDVTLAPLGLNRNDRGGVETVVYALTVNRRAAGGDVAAFEIELDINGTVLAVSSEQWTCTAAARVLRCTDEAGSRRPISSLDVLVRPEGLVAPEAGGSKTPLLASLAVAVSGAGYLWLRRRTPNTGN